MVHSPEKCPISRMQLWILTKDAVTLCITMVGVMAFWMGIMEIASRAGIIEMAYEKNETADPIFVS